MTNDEFINKWGMVGDKDMRYELSKDLNLLKKNKTVPPPSDDVIEVVKYFCLVTKKKFKPDTYQTNKIISARLKDYPKEQLKLVIDIKSAQWLGDESMDKYLTPTTLFRESNFEKYINEVPRYTPPKTIGFNTTTSDEKYNKYVKSRKALGINWLSYNEWKIKFNKNEE